MRHSYKIKKNELLYVIALFIYTFAVDVISNSYLFGQNDSRFEVSNYFQYLAAALFFVSFCWNKNLKIRAIMLRVILGVIALVIAYNMHAISFGVSVLAIIAALNIDFRKIVKWCVGINTFDLVVVILPAIMGLIPDETRLHNGVVAHYLGFAYYSNVPYRVLMITIMGYWLIKSSRAENIFLLISIPIQYIIYKVCTVRLVLYIYIIFIIIAILIRAIKSEKKHNVLKFIAVIMYPCATLATVYASLQSDKSFFFAALDSAMNARLSFNRIGFQRYGMKLFGQRIITSQEYWDANYINHYFFIDSGYAYMLISYGLIFSIILIGGYSYLSWYTIRYKDYKMFVWCITCCIFSVINNVLFSVSLNPLPVLAVNLFVNANVMKKKRK